MKAYNDYLDAISVSNTLHNRFVSCATNAGPARYLTMVRRYAAAFACLAVVLLGALTVPRLFPENTLPIAGLSQQPAAGGHIIMGSGSSDKNEKHEQDLSPAKIIDGSGYAQADACYPVPEPGACQFIAPVSDAMADYAGTDAVLFVAINIFSADENPLADGSEEMQKEIRRLTDLGYPMRYSQAWTYQGKGEQIPYTYLSGLFTVEALENFPAGADYGYSFYFAHNGDGSPAIVDVSAFEPPGDDLDLTAAYADPDFGAYLPVDLPSGFTFESATRVNDQEKNSLSALWIKGMGEIHWRVSALGEDDQARITSIADRQNYDLARYPIPRADSVPDELREIVTDPIFRMEDLTLEVVQARADEAADAGDISGPRMRFSVLYGDILVEIRIKGATPEDIFQLLQQIEK